MNIVELYSGSSNFSNEMRKMGHNVIDIDLNPNTPAKIHDDVANYSIDDLKNLFENKKIDFIFAAPDLFSYFFLRGHCREKELWTNILNKCDCKFIVEQISMTRDKDYRKNKFTFNLDYSKFDPNLKHKVPISTNCEGLDDYINEHLYDNLDISDYKKYRGETPHKLIKLICDFINTKYN